MPEQIRNGLDSLTRRANASTTCTWSAYLCRGKLRSSSSSAAGSGGGGGSDDGKKPGRKLAIHGKRAKGEGKNCCGCCSQEALYTTVTLIPHLSSRSHPYDPVGEGACSS